MSSLEQDETGGDLSQHSNADPHDYGWVLVAGGVVWGGIQVIRGRHRILDLVLPIAMTGVGVAILTMDRRQRIHVAEENILAELDGLDPIAKAQVLKAVAEEEMKAVDPTKVGSRKGK